MTVWDDSEKAVEVGMIEWLESQGYHAKKVHSGAVMIVKGDNVYKMELASEGTPDIYAIVRGLPVTIEVKKNAAAHAEWTRQWERYKETGIARKSYRRSLAQHFEQEKIRAAGGFTITCSTLEELQADIEELLSDPQNAR